MFYGLVSAYANVAGWIHSERVRMESRDGYPLGSPSPSYGPDCTQGTRARARECCARATLVGLHWSAGVIEIERDWMFGLMSKLLTHFLPFV